MISQHSVLMHKNNIQNRETDVLPNPYEIKQSLNVHIDTTIGNQWEAAI